MTYNFDYECSGEACFVHNIYSLLLQIVGHIMFSTPKWDSKMYSSYYNLSTTVHSCDSQYVL